MNHDQSRTPSSIIPAAAPVTVPQAPPLPAVKPLQRARDAAYRFIGIPSRPPSPNNEFDSGRFSLSPSFAARYASLSAAQNASASHKTGLEINTIAINEKGTHALLGGKEIFKTVRVEDGTCAEELNLRAAIRSTPTHASGRPRQIYSIDIADVAWAKGDCGDFVAAATSSGKIILYDLGHVGLQAVQLHEHYRQVHKVTFNPHRGNLLLSGSQDGTVRLWDLRDVKHQANTLQSKRKYSGQSDGVRDVKWSPSEGVDFAFGTDSGWIQRWDIRNLKSAKVRIPAHSLACNAIDWHPDGKHIASAGTDKSVRVWDFSSDRKQKAAWEIRTPYPAMNTRWRPSCESSMPQDHHARLCTQIVTSYDRDHPVMHVWDFRRPALAFRELSPHPSAPSDFLWHSQDLLWTVGREGVFLQTDIHHAPKVIEKRNLQALAISPLGDVNFVAQKRGHRHLPNLHETPPADDKQNHDSSVSQKQITLSRSWADDSLDHSFLSIIPTKRSSRTRGKSIMPHNLAVVLKLDEILLNRLSFRPQQVAARGLLPFHIDPAVVEFLAKNYVHCLDPDLRESGNLLEAVESAIDLNANVAYDAGLYRLAQEWRIMGHITVHYLRSKAKAREERRKKGEAQLVKRVDSDSAGRLAKRILTELNKSPSDSPASLRPVSTLANHLINSESTSNVPTPLARPVTSSRMQGLADDAKLLDPDHDESLALPPSVTTPPVHLSASEVAVGKKLTTCNLEDLRKQYAESTGAERVDMVKKWSIHPRERLSLDPVDSNGARVPPTLVKHDSDESFSFMGSTDSREPSMPGSFASIESGPLRMVSEHPSRAKDILPDENLSAQRPPSTDAPTAVHLTAGEVHPPDVYDALGSEKLAPLASDGTARPLGHSCAEPLDLQPDDENFDCEQEMPWTVVDMLRSLIDYHSGKYGNAQQAAQLLLLLIPLLPPTNPLPDSEVEATVTSYAETLGQLGYLPEEVATMIDKQLAHTMKAGLQPMQIESILCAYHEQLMANRLLIEASHLRRLCYPIYPSVYEQALQDNIVHLKCGRCGRAMPRGGSRERCKHCTERPSPCPYCCTAASPYGQSGSWTICLLCGHGAHASCLRKWFVDNAGDACPTYGCLCDCVDGAWRDEKAHKAAERRGAKARGKVKSDEWEAHVSEAVEKAGAALRGAKESPGARA